MRRSTISSLSLCVLLVLPLALNAEDPPVAPAAPGTAKAKPEPSKKARTPRRRYALGIDAEEAGAAAIKLFDTNKDGKLSSDELTKCPGVKAAINEIDPSGNGEITAEKIAARIKAWQDSRLARMTIACVVFHNGQPLAGAKVKFVPEKFLGKNIETATGTTDHNGVAMLSVPAGPREPPGVGPGFYRVEITKAGEQIPAEYNTDTILGQEVARDAKGIIDMKGIKFDLKYSPGQ
jgi:hypothetical protein